MNIIDFEPEHILHIKPQRAQVSAPLTLKYAEQIASGPCFTGIHNGEVVAIGGLIEVNQNRAFLHMIVAENMPHQWVKLYRAARRLIDVVDYLRIEALSGFDEADRWLEMLGFEYEGTLRGIMPDGSDAKSYSIVRK